MIRTKRKTFVSGRPAKVVHLRSPILQNIRRIAEPVLRNKFTMFVVAAMLVMVGCPALIATIIHGQASTGASPDAWMQTSDAKTDLRVYRVDTGAVENMPLNAYIANVLAAEFNTSAPTGALEAAAVAARTYAIHAIEAKDYQKPTYARSHGADVTTSATLDLPWITEAQQEQKFGDHAALMTARIEQAVTQTDGQILTYKDRPILAFMFPLSGGKTRDATATYQQPLPYLRAVACPDDKLAATYTYAFAAGELGKGLHIAIDPNTWHPTDFKIGARDASGYVQTVIYGNRTWTGDEFAEKLKLPSSDFQFTQTAQSAASQQLATLTIETMGVGSGYGMSLHEAEALAAKGMDAATILARFYPGTQLVSQGQGQSESEAKAET